MTIVQKASPDLRVNCTFAGRTCILHKYLIFGRICVFVKGTYYNSRLLIAPSRTASRSKLYD